MTPSYRSKGMNTYDYARTMNDLYAANFEENPKYNNTEMSKYYMGYLNQQGKAKRGDHESGQRKIRHGI